MCPQSPPAAQEPRRAAWRGHSIRLIIQTALPIRLHGANTLVEHALAVCKAFCRTDYSKMGTSMRDKRKMVQANNGWCTDAQIVQWCYQISQGHGGAMQGFITRTPEANISPASARKHREQAGRTSKQVFFVNNLQRRLSPKAQGENRQP